MSRTHEYIVLAASITQDADGDYEYDYQDTSHTIELPTRITDSEVLRRVHDAGLLGVIDLASLDCDPQHEGGFFIALKNGPTLLSLEPA